MYALVPVVPSVGGLFALINEAWLLWDPRRQCLHDKAARTVVVKTRSERGGVQRSPAATRQFSSRSLPDLIRSRSQLNSSLYPAARSG